MSAINRNQTGAGAGWLSHSEDSLCAFSRVRESSVWVQCLGPVSGSGCGEDFLFSGQVRPSAAAADRRTGPVLAPLRAAGPAAAHNKRHCCVHRWEARAGCVDASLPVDVSAAASVCSFTLRRSSRESPRLRKS